MVVVGADVHKRTHTFVAVNEVGQQLGELRVSADGKGHAKALRWARQQFPGERRWVSRTAGICRPGWSGTC
jgi:transposase